MTKKHILWIGVVIISLLVFVLGDVANSLGDDDLTLVARAKFIPVDGSGVQGTIFFLQWDDDDIEEEIGVFGISWGLDPARGFISLLNNAPDCMGDEVLLGIWTVGPRGFGVLSAILDDITDLADVESVSLRQADDDALLACGMLEIFDFDQARIRRR